MFMIMYTVCFIFRLEIQDGPPQQSSLANFLGSYLYRNNNLQNVHFMCGSESTIVYILFMLLNRNRILVLSRQIKLSSKLYLLKEQFEIYILHFQDDVTFVSDLLDPSRQRPPLLSDQIYAVSR